MNNEGSDFTAWNVTSVYFRVSKQGRGPVAPRQVTQEMQALWRELLSPRFEERARYSPIPNPDLSSSPSLPPGSPYIPPLSLGNQLGGVGEGEAEMGKDDIRE